MEKRQGTLRLSFPNYLKKLNLIFIFFLSVSLQQLGSGT